jgi:hypothetical protein
MPTTTTTTTLTAPGGTTTTTATTTVPDEVVPPSGGGSGSGGPIVVYNWPMLGRFGAQFLMMDHAGIEYEHIEEFDQLAAKCTAFGGKVGNVAPPILVDGSMALSQSYAQSIYIGRKAGLETGNFCEFKAMQMLADIDDWLLNNFKPGIQTLTSTDFLQTFCAPGGRWSVMASAIELNIEGGFTFGNGKDMRACVYLHHLATLS